MAMPGRIDAARETSAPGKTGHSRPPPGRVNFDPKLPSTCGQPLIGDEGLVVSSASLAGVVVTGYVDRAEGIMIEEDGGEGQFASVVLRPKVTISPESDAALAEHLHQAAHEKCFIARSVGFPVTHEAMVVGAHTAGLQ